MRSVGKYRGSCARGRGGAGRAPHGLGRGGERERKAARDYGGYLFQTVSPSAPPEAGRPRGVQSRRRASISPHLKLPLLKVYYRAHPWPSPGPSGPSGARAGCRAAFRGVGTPKGPCGVECGGSAGPPQAARAWVRPALWAPQAELGAPGGGLRVRSCADKQRPQRVPLGSTGQVGRGLCPPAAPHLAARRSGARQVATLGALLPASRGAGSRWDRGRSHHPARARRPGRRPPARALWAGRSTPGASAGDLGRHRGEALPRLAAGGSAARPLCGFVPRSRCPVTLPCTLAVFLHLWPLQMVPF